MVSKHSLLKIPLTKGLFHGLFKEHFDTLLNRAPEHLNIFLPLKLKYRWRMSFWHILNWESPIMGR